MALYLRAGSATKVSPGAKRAKIRVCLDCECTAVVTIACHGYHLDEELKTGTHGYLRWLKCMAHHSHPFFRTQKMPTSDHLGSEFVLSLDIRTYVYSRPQREGWEEE